MMRTNKCRCGTIINHEKNSAKVRSDKRLFFVWLCFTHLHRYTTYISENASPTRETVLIITNVRKYCDKSLAIPDRVTMYCQVCDIFSACTHITIDNYLFLIEKQMPCRIDQFAYVTFKVDRQYRRNQILAIVGAWKMDNDVHSSYIQWLPREICEDLIAII